MSEAIDYYSFWLINVDTVDRVDNLVFPPRCCSWWWEGHLRDTEDETSAKRTLYSAANRWLRCRKRSGVSSLN